MAITDNYDPSLLVGTTIDDKYAVVRYIDGGGYGFVYAVSELASGNNDSLAVKVILPGHPQHIWEELPSEIVILRDYPHENLIKVFDFGLFMEGEFKGSVYYVMELAEYSLSDYILKQAGIENNEVIDIISQVSSALWHLNSSDIAHRDVKPANILYAGGVWKVSDLGLCRHFDHELTRVTHVRAGTIIYMPPEANYGTTGVKGDAWSIGVLIFHCLEGEMPFSYLDIREYSKQLTPPLSNVMYECSEMDPVRRCACCDVLQMLGVKESYYSVDQQQQKFTNCQTISVNKEGVGDYATLNEALDSVQFGVKCVIEVSSGHYLESIVIDKEVYLKAADNKGRVEIYGVSGPGIEISSQNVILEDLEIYSMPGRNGDDNPAVDVKADNVIIDQCELCSPSSIAIQMDNGNDNIVVRDSKITSGEGGIFIGNYSKASIDGVVIRSEAVGIHVTENAHCSVINSDIRSKSTAIFAENSGEVEIDKCGIHRESIVGVQASNGRIQVNESTINACEIGVLAQNDSDVQIVKGRIINNRKLAIEANNSFVSIIGVYISSNTKSFNIREGVVGSAINCVFEGNAEGITNVSNEKFRIISRD